MKSTFILLLICLLSGSTGFSQTQKDNRYFGGNLRFGTDKIKFDDGGQAQSSNLNARVDAGTFLYDNFAIGAALQMERQAFPEDTKSRYFIPQLLGTARYYAGTEKAKIFLAGQLGLSLFHSSHLEFPDTDKEKRIGSTEVGGAYGIGAGVAWFLSPGIAVEGTMGWEGYSMPKSKSNVSFTGLKIGLTAYLGQAGKKLDTARLEGQDTSIYGDYGKKVGIGISIFDGIGVPVRYYFSPKKVLEAGIYYGGIVVRNNDEFQLGSGLMLGGGYTFFGSRYEKESKGKIRANGLALRLNYLTGDYSAAMLSAGWAMETFRKGHPNRSFIFELGLREQFPNFELKGEPVKAMPTVYLRWQVVFFVK